MRGYLHSRKTIPPLGAVSIVGKDSEGRKLVLPTHYGIEQEAKVNKKTSFSKQARSVFNAVMGKFVNIFNKEDYKKEREKMYQIRAKEANQITQDYMSKVDERLAPLRFKKDLENAI